MTLPSRLPRHCVADSWFRERFGAPLPRELREQAGAMSWETFAAAYSHSAGPVRLRHFACTDPQRPAGRLGPQARNFRAVIAVGDHISTCAAAAGGPVAALTAMLHSRGITLETLSFHQMQSEDCTVTCIRGSNGHRGEWALGLAADPTESALRAVIACVNRLVT
ncbi:homocitrate synthase [Mycobacterium intermedium]|uniref:Homocitrate synthase n=1 Tax=Mycobacterium intermedium TaxID=28445 RepID=A0A1E3S9J9_MYCIE|nr:homocitrate synthase [Mycobacterium intermedium]MCV6966611.1 homocitrate synthase [Mycobacterium intermedium]ODQ98800.1 homocitrate synthase [Mycobacterium intermedium]ORB04665.1 homocitrate synthase [Mycobacterium intermedium]